MKIDKSYQVNKPMDKNLKERPYDIVMLYCKMCKKRIDLKVFYPLGKSEHFQLVNLPERISKHLGDRTVVCNHCDKKFILEKLPDSFIDNYIMKLDCSGMSPGMESWYEDAIPKYSTDIYA